MAADEQADQPGAATARNRQACLEQHDDAEPLIVTNALKTASGHTDDRIRMHLHNALNSALQGGSGEVGTSRAGVGSCDGSRCGRCESCHSTRYPGAEALMTV